MGLIKVILHDLGYRSAGMESISSEEYDISKCYSYEDDIQIQQTRDGISGVFVQISIPQTFYKEAYDAIRETFESNLLNSYGRISIYKRDEINVTDYELLDTFELDFATLQILDNSLTIDLVKLGLQQLINSNSSTKYDIPVYNPGTMSMRYNRIYLEFERNLNVFCDEEFVYSRSGIIYPAINIQSTKNELRIPAIVLNSIEETFAPSFVTSTLPFFQNNTSEYVPVTISYSFVASYSYTGAPPTSTILMFSQVESGLNPLHQIYLTTTPTRYTGSFTANIAASVSRRTGIRLFINVSTGSSDSTSFRLRIVEQEYFRINFTAKDTSLTYEGYPYINIPFIDASVMLGTIISRITNSNDYISSIEWVEEDSNNVYMALVAAESIRGYEDKGFYHISFNDFSTWLYTLGYVITYPSDKEIKFVNYEKLFLNDSPTVLDKNDVADLEISATTDNSFTNISIGYTEQKYDSENGRFNVNGTFDYSTGLILKDENKLNLVSPFRSDHVGAELLVFQRINSNVTDSTDNKADNDIFSFRLNASRELDVEVSYAENSKVKTYDGALNPRSLAERWLKYLGTSSDIMRFESTNANRTAYISGLELYGDIILFDNLLSPVLYKINCQYIANLYNTDVWKNPVKFEYSGKEYSGYIVDALKTFSKETTSELTLVASGNSISIIDDGFGSFSPDQQTFQYILPDGLTALSSASTVNWISATLFEGDNTVNITLSENIYGSDRTGQLLIRTNEDVTIRLTINQRS